MRHGDKRRAQIVDAAITVIAEVGVEAMSHRRVAAAAGVPLAATTYYFGSLDELRAAAVGEIVRGDVAEMETQFGSLPDNDGLAEVLAWMLFRWLSDPVAPSMTVEFVASAMRREAIRDVTQPWQAAWLQALEPRVGRVRAMAAVTVSFGYIRHALMQDELPRLEEMIALMRGCLTPRG